jgi:subtilisin family serine protease
MNLFLKIFLLLLISSSFSSNLVAQRKYDLYWVGFTDKNGTPYSVFHPQEYLSARALERRSKYGIRIDSSDLPINQAYLDPIRIKGFKIHLESRWLNGVVVKVNGDASVTPKDLLSFDFIKEVFPVGFSRSVLPIPDVGERDFKKNYKKKKNYYGYGANQIEKLNGHYLHKMNYKGEGMHVAIFDGGFDGLLETPAFDSLIINNQIIETKDFVEGDDYVYESSTHGRDVLSTMAANMPFLFVGTAPNASYYLFKTEDHPLGEYIVEEYNWVAAAEYSDQIGIDVINSSLGYHHFDDKNMDYAYSDLDGTKSPMTIGATKAAEKGILVVSAAGNEGNDKWKHITVPNDAENILTVGAVDRDGYYARFSSLGFAEKAILKPNVMARGAIAVVAAKRKYGTSFSNGTSFASPIMAGMATSFWQALPQMTPQEIIYTLQNHATYSDKPDNAMGYGVPDFLAAHIAQKNSIIKLTTENEYYYHSEDLDKNVNIFIEKMDAVDITYNLYNHLNKVVYTGSDHVVNLYDKKLWHMSIPDWQNMPNGAYTLEIQLEDKMKRILLLK